MSVKKKIEVCKYDGAIFITSDIGTFGVIRCLNDILLFKKILVSRNEAVLNIKSPLILIKTLSKLRIEYDTITVKYHKDVMKLFDVTKNIVTYTLT